MKKELQRLVTEPQDKDQSSKTGLQDLPLVEVPANISGSDVLAVMLSGDE